MTQTYNVIFQFKNKPILVFQKISLEEVVGLVGLHGKDLISCQIERVNNE